MKGSAAGISDALNILPTLPTPTPTELSGPESQWCWSWEILTCKQVGMAVFQ